MHIYRIAGISLILTLFFYLHPAFGFKYQNARWRLADLPIPCHLNTAFMPQELALGDVEQATIRSLAAWNEAAGLQLFEYAGLIELESPLADDEWNAISFVLADWLEVTDGLSVNRFTAGTTCTWSARDAIGAPPRQGFAKNDFLRAFDIVINAENYRWTIGVKVNQYDLQSAITHELGHVLSLGHPDDDPHPADAPTMVEQMFPNNTKLRTLESDDIAGVQSIYRKVSGTLHEGEYWENMVVIDGDVIVSRGVSLNINHSTPQTIVHFSPGCKLIIEGGLTVDAATFKQVLFTGIDNAQWDGVRIHANDQACRISYCAFEDTQVPITLLSAQDVSVADCTFDQCPDAIRVTDSGNISILDCIFEHAETAVALQSTTNVTIEGCEFRGNLVGIHVFNGQSLSVGSKFQENNVGVEVQSSHEVEIIQSILDKNDIGLRLIDTTAQVHTCQFTENNTGVELQKAQSVRLRENAIVQNQIGIRVVDGTVDLGKAPGAPGRNNLLSNAVWNIILENPSPGPLFAQGNYWGELTLAEIDATIRDDEETENLPAVVFEPILNELELVQSGWIVVYTGMEETYSGLSQAALPLPISEGLIDAWTFKATGTYRPDYSTIPGYFRDGRLLREAIILDKHGEDGTLKQVTAQHSFKIQWSPRSYLLHFHIVNLDPCTPDFTVEPLLSRDSEHNPATAFAPSYVMSLKHIRIEDIQAEGRDFFTSPITIPDLPIEGDSEEFYIWARFLFDDGKAPVIVPGKWIAINEDLPDLVGGIDEIPPSASTGTEINVRYWITNYGRPIVGTQTVQFYLSASEVKDSPPQPDYPLLPAIQLPALEGGWSSQLTIPMDVPEGDYDLWMQVDADNDVIEWNSSNNPATYLAYRIRIDASEKQEPVGIQPRGKRLSIWSRLKTTLFQNYPNPFNPETWIPYQLSEDADIAIHIYDIKGQFVHTIALSNKQAGVYFAKDKAAYWNGRDSFGGKVASGVYFYTLKAGDFRATRKMVILK